MVEEWASGQVATDRYRARLDELVEPGMHVLHAGCGWDKNTITRDLKNKARVVGVDLDPRVGTQFHSEFYLASLEALPFADATFDVICSEYVFEHIEDPDTALNELRRVLRPGGTILILTPNLYSYKTLASKLTPQRFHITMGRHRYGAGHEADMYPTLYRCNTESAFMKFAYKNGLDIGEIEYITNGPTWFAKIPGLFDIFHVFHLTIRRFAIGAKLRCAMVVELTRPG